METKKQPKQKKFTLQMKHLLSSLSGFISELFPTFESNCVNPGGIITCPGGESMVSMACCVCCWWHLFLKSSKAVYFVVLLLLLLLLLWAWSTVVSVLVTWGSERGLSSVGEEFSKILKRKNVYFFRVVDLPITVTFRK